MNEIPEEWRPLISRLCFWLADNYATWQPFALAFFVVLLLVSLTIVVEMWGR
jgi:hypothetical protein